MYIFFIREGTRGNMGYWVWGGTVEYFFVQVQQVFYVGRGVTRACVYVAKNLSSHPSESHTLSVSAD